MKQLKKCLDYNKKILIFQLIATLIIGVAFFAYLYKIPVNNYELNVASANPDIGRMEADGYYFDSEHIDQITEDNQKIWFNIPTYVKKGSYTLRIGYRSGAASTLSVSSRTNPDSVKCDYVALTHLPEELPGEYNMNYGMGFLPGFSYSDLYITKDVNDLDIFVVYCGFREFHIESVELIGNRNYIKTIYPAFMVIVMILDFVTSVICTLIEKKREDIQSYEKSLAVYKTALLIIIIAVFSSIPLFSKMGLLFDDGQFLYGRINGIMDGILEGQFPVRIHPNTLEGYGYALPYFYPELFLYPFALLRILGYSLRFVTYVLIFVMNIATAGISYYSVKRITNDGKIALFGAFIYTFSLYRLVDVYSRGALSEAIAIVFLPLFFMGLHLIFRGEKAWVSLFIAIAGLINSHILSCEMVLLFSILFTIPYLKEFIHKEVFIDILKAGVLAVGISMYFIGPFIHMSMTDSYKVYAKNAYDTSQNVLSLSDIFAVINKASGNINSGFLDGRYTLGIVVLLLATVLLILAVNVKANADIELVLKQEKKFVIVMFALGTIAIWLSSALFPWKAIENLGGVIRSVFCMVQFPWRYLSIAMVCYLFSICGSIKIVLNYGNRVEQKNRYIIVSLTVACTLILIQSMVFFLSLKDTASDEHLIYDGAAIRKYGLTGMGEYEPVSFMGDNLDLSIEELQVTVDENVIINPTGEDGNKGLTIGPLSKSGTDISILAINPTDSEQILYMPITYYYGYRVSNIAEDPAGNNVIPELFETDFGTVGLRIPVGYYNGVHIEYVEPIIYRFFELLSVVTFAGLLVGAILRKRKMC